MRQSRSKPLWVEMHVWLQLERQRLPDGSGIAGGDRLQPEPRGGVVGLLASKYVAVQLLAIRTHQPTHQSGGIRIPQLPNRNSAGAPRGSKACWVLCSSLSSRGAGLVASKVRRTAHVAAPPALSSRKQRLNLSRQWLDCLYQLVTLGKEGRKQWRRVDHGPINVAMELLDDPKTVEQHHLSNVTRHGPPASAVAKTLRNE